MVVEHRRVTDAYSETPDHLPKTRRQALCAHADHRDLVARSHAPLDDGARLGEHRSAAEKCLRGVGPIAPRTAIHCDDNGLDDGRADAGILDGQRRAGWTGVHGELDVRPHLGHIVLSLQRCFVDSDGDGRDADDERRERNERFGLGIPPPAARPLAPVVTIRHVSVIHEHRGQPQRVRWEARWRCVRGSSTRY